MKKLIIPFLFCLLPLIVSGQGGEAIEVGGHGDNSGNTSTFSAPMTSAQLLSGDTSIIYSGGSGLPNFGTMEVTLSAGTNYTYAGNDTIGYFYCYADSVPRKIGFLSGKFLSGAYGLTTYVHIIDGRYDSGSPIWFDAPPDLATGTRTLTFSLPVGSSGGNVMNGLSESQVAAMVSDSVEFLKDTVSLSQVLDTLSADSLRVLSTNPTKGNIYLNSADNRIHYLEGGYWYRLSVSDSTYDYINSSINDGDTEAWYVYDDLSTITKTAVTNKVTAWNDKLGSGHNLIQADSTTPKTPIYSSNGVLFDGTNDVMETVGFTWNQPCVIIMVVKQVTWTDYDYLFDGNTAAGSIAVQRGTTPEIRIQAGNYLTGNTQLAVDTWGIMTVSFNGASSFMQINQTAQTTGNAGTNNMGGFALGGNADGAQNSNIQVKEIILRKSTTDLAAIYTYLSNKYGL